MARPLLIGIGLVAILYLGSAGCKSAKEQAKTFKECGQGRGCKSPNVCIRVGRTREGICVYPCHNDRDCPKPFLCTGAYRLRGKGGAYCRRPSRDVGGDCSRIQDGCKRGLRCFNSKCVRECRSIRDCPDKTKRCLKVVDKTGAGDKGLYRGCLAAVQKHGQRCTKGGPFCARDHLCYRSSCIKTCKDDKGCAKGMICDGAFYTGKNAKQNKERGAVPDVRYCRTAGGKNAACNLTMGKTCARGLFCLGSRCRQITRAAVGKRCHERRGIFCAKGASCFAGRCRKECKINGDCPRQRRKPGKCELRTLRGRKRGLCF